jgi:hypothetical protein
VLWRLVGWLDPRTETLHHPCCCPGTAAAALHQARGARALCPSRGAPPRRAHLRRRARGQPAPETLPGGRPVARQVAAHCGRGNRLTLLPTHLLAQLPGRGPHWWGARLCDSNQERNSSHSVHATFASFAQADDGFVECPTESCAHDSCLDFLLRCIHSNNVTVPIHGSITNNSCAGSVHPWSQPRSRASTTQAARWRRPARRDHPCHHRHLRCHLQTAPHLLRGRLRLKPIWNDALATTKRTGRPTVSSFRTHSARMWSPTTPPKPRVCSTCYESRPRRAKGYPTSHRASWCAFAVQHAVCALSL